MEVLQKELITNLKAAINGDENGDICSNFEKQSVTYALLTGWCGKRTNIIVTICYIRIAHGF